MGTASEARRALGPEGQIVNDEEFEAFLDTALDELEHKQDQLKADFGLGRYPRFWFDQPSGTLEFRDAAGTLRVIADVIPVGSHSRRSGTWTWAWAHEILLPALRKSAEPLQKLEAVTGLGAFLKATVPVEDDEMAWELTALAVRHLGAIGAHKTPGQASDLYLAITSVKRGDTD